MRTVTYPYASDAHRHENLLVDASAIGQELGFHRAVVLDGYAHSEAVDCYTAPCGAPDRMLEVLASAYHALAAAPTGAARVLFAVHRLVGACIGPVPLVIEEAPDCDGSPLWLISSVRGVPRFEWSMLQERVFRLKRGFQRPGRAGEIDTRSAQVLSALLDDNADRAEDSASAGTRRWILETFVRLLREELRAGHAPAVHRELVSIVDEMAIELAPPIALAANHWADALFSPSSPERGYMAAGGKHKYAAGGRPFGKPMPPYESFRMYGTGPRAGR
ncbi:hypothetical protein ACFWPH_28370 [Nocardia sp. NPDC058499]|uniref:hypothetical protein n=1 Tax=Nocardia sp. NPDC058499 TaxID=3346530 RepID=UPI00365E6F0C